MKIENYFQLLKTLDIFSDFSSKELEELFNIDKYKISFYKKNSMIHFESEKCTTLDVILKGKITVQKVDINGNVLTVSEFSQSEILGGNLLYAKSPFYPMTIIAKVDTKILHIDKSLVLTFCQANKNFLINYLKEISDKTIILTSKIKSIHMKSIRESITDFLTYEYYLQKSNNIKLNMTKKDLAERMGIQRTSLSRELNKMRNEGLVQFDKDSITIVNLNSILK
ncbi:hypothetical protein SH2C18_23670 [Clostridium sediminicola]|uniref:Crp/Fnr family transcriptional regulator n=1 Tax=Clostridium sediminicola TaxID=3114879 RepID=UPI0031F1CD29